LNVVARRAEAELAAEARELDKVRVDCRWIVLECLDPRILLPVITLALDPVRDDVAFLGRRLAGHGHVAVIRLPLDLAIVFVTTEPDLENGGQIRIPINDDVVTALRPRQHMREEGDLIEPQRAVAGVDR
jgi:hypothetical protein